MKKWERSLPGNMRGRRPLEGRPAAAPRPKPQAPPAARPVAARSTAEPAVPLSMAPTCFATCPPGLEPWLADELRELGVVPTLDEGGCAFSGDRAALYRANLQLRLASRVLVRVAQFHVGQFSQLEKRIAALPWATWLKRGQALRVEAVCHRSKLYHEKGVVERIERLLQQRMGATRAPDRESGQVVLARIVANECTISIDSSGELLHRRGYRQELTKATLRETLAAAVIAFSGWDRKTPLLDPFCGSGTIAIEAALRARNLAPGRQRRFAFMDWPDFDQTLWATLLREAEAQATGTCPPILASDRDAGAVAITRANAERAGVLENIDISCRALKSVAPPPGPLHIVTNPPYGQRIEGGGDLRNLYASLGNLVHARGDETRLTFISSDPRWTGNVGLRFELGPRLTNGSIPIRFARELKTPVPDDRQLCVEAQRRGLGPGDVLLVVDVAEQTLRVWQDRQLVAVYPVSTGRRGVGNRQDSLMTPPGWHEVKPEDRMGGDKPAGTVFKARVPTGEVVGPKAPGVATEDRDLILSRILWLSGLEDGVNRGPGIDTHERFIYLHGTIHEDRIGTPASAGCVRLGNRAIVKLFERCRDRRVLVWIG